MSSIFEMLFLISLVIMCLVSSLYEIDVRVGLLADVIWEADDDKTGFFIVIVNDFDQTFM